MHQYNKLRAKKESTDKKKKKREERHTNNKIKKNKRKGEAYNKVVVLNDMWDSFIHIKK